MANSWDDMRKAKEESYFDRKNREAIERLAAHKQEKPRPSPITGEPMVQEVIHGIVIDRCPTSGGIWLDRGELEQLLEIGGDAAGAGKPESGWAGSLLRGLVGK